MTPAQELDANPARKDIAAFANEVSVALGSLKSQLVTAQTTTGIDLSGPLEAAAAIEAVIKRAEV